MASSLIRIIYSSVANFDFSEKELADLLTVSRSGNEKINVSGILLYTERSFFQVLEGDRHTVEELFTKIGKDKRHSQVVTIIKEPIPRRTFGEWSMGFANISQQDLGNMTGLNDFFGEGSSFNQIDQGRVKKLLTAFKEGRWRSKIINSNTPSKPVNQTESKVSSKPTPKNDITFAFQPIVDINTKSIVSYEALVRGLDDEPARVVLKEVEEDALSNFDSRCRTTAIEIAAKQGLNCNLNLNFWALDVRSTQRILKETIEVAKHNNIDPRRLTLEIDQEKFIGNTVNFGEAIEECRSVGVQVSIDHFGVGRASLSLLEMYRPDMISLSIDLVREIESNGSRQAIVRGLAQTCGDLGIDIIIKYIETLDGYLWFRSEGFNLFQGNLFAKPGFESLPSAVYPTG